MWYVVINPKIPAGAGLFTNVPASESNGKVWMENGNDLPIGYSLEEFSFGDVSVRHEQFAYAYVKAPENYLDHMFIPSAMVPEMCGVIRDDTKKFCRATAKFHRC